MTLAMVKVLPEPVTPEQRLEGEPVVDALDQLGDRLGLVARRRERLVQLERAIGKSEVHG